MKLLAFSLLIMLTGCSSQIALTYVPITVGDCYYYHRATRHPRGPFVEKANPFWFRAESRKGRHVKMSAYVMYDSLYVRKLQDTEKKLSRYSRPVPCLVIDSLSRLAKRL